MGSEERDDHENSKGIFDAALRRVNRAVEKVEKMADSHSNNTSHSTVSFQMGGIGLWSAVGCCVLMVALLSIVVPIGVGAFLFQQGQITKLQQGENAIRARFERDARPLPPRTEGKKDE